MEQNMTLRIDTRLGVGRMEKEMREVTASLSAMIGKTTLITSGLFAKVKGQLATLTKSVTAAGKAAQMSLAAFDELNIAQRGLSGGGGGSGSKPEKPELPELELPDWLQPMWDALAWGYKNVLEPLRKWFADKAVPAYLELLASAGNLLREALDALRPLASWLWESFLVPLGQWSGDMLLLAMDSLRDRLAALTEWIAKNRESIDAFWQTLQPLMEAVGTTFGNLLDGIKQLFGGWYEAMTGMLSGYLETWTGLLTGDWEQAWEGVKQIFESGKTFILETLGTLWQLVSENAAAVWTGLQELLAPVWEWFLTTIIEPLQQSFGWLWEGIALAADICWQAIKAIWEPVSSWLQQKVVTPVWNLVKKLWDDLLTLANNGLDMVLGAVKGYLEGVITLATGGVNVIISLINRIIDGLNSISVDIPDWVPEYGGRSFGINIPYIPKVSLPKLATGAVIPANREFLAVLGDQKQGRNLEAPESLIRQIVREETAGMAGDNDQPLVANLVLDGDIIYQTVVDRQNRQGYSVGGVFANCY